jgi:ABC-type lipoprotein export system ATPase subunit
MPLLGSPHKYQTFSIQGLFGSVNHDIKFSQESHITILAGPNGCGKTHVLKLYRALLGLDILTLTSSPYSAIAVTLKNNAILRAARKEEGDLVILNLMGRTENGETHQARFASTDLASEGTEGNLPAHFHPTVEGRWLDSRTGRYYSAEYIERHYNVSSSVEYMRTNIITANPWLTDLVPETMPILIDTKRLDTSPSTSPRTVDQAIHARTIGLRGGAGRIGEYIDQVRFQITEARRESLQRSQEADEKFAATLLRRSRSTVKEERLKARYQRLAEMHAELNESGLTGQAVAVQFPPTTNPTERRILNVFIDDWERKLAPLIPVNEKIKVLRRIINEKFIGKTLSFDSRGIMRFTAGDDVAVAVDQLSSGEQHLLALFTMLLFSAQPGSIVLIDEPEISLHAAWKHAFVGDLEQVAAVSDLSVMFATHSSAIINGRWDLVRELTVSN